MPRNSHEYAVLGFNTVLLTLVLIFVYPAIPCRCIDHELIVAKACIDKCVDERARFARAESIFDAAVPARHVNTFDPTLTNSVGLS